MPDLPDLQKLFQELMAGPRSVAASNPFTTAPIGATPTQMTNEGSAVATRASNTPTTTPDKVSENDRIRAAVLDTLSALGKLTTGDDALIFEGSRFVLPENMKGDISGAAQYLMDYERNQEKKFNFSRKFNYRVWDGAAAFDRAMKRVFGTSGTGKSTYGMFGEEYKPEFRTVNVSPTDTIQVPWGTVAFPPLSAEFSLGGTRDKEYGIVFLLQVEAPRKYRAHIEAFYKVLEQELQTGSIYRGKAITGADEPSFIDTNQVDPSKVIYSEDVMVQLETNMWSLLRYTDRMRENGIPLKRAVLVEGPYGTGKTLAGNLTAREAVANGWTFLLARPSKDNLQEVLQTAQLYAPAVVWYEDIDVLAQGHSDVQISALLDSLDGITNKGVEILAGFTTNHVQKIQKGVLRPGRLDAVIHVGGLDANGFEKLTRVVIPADRLSDEVDFTLVAKAFEGFLPAFAKEAIDRALRYSISRNRGLLDVITTEDLVNAAEGLRPQLELMQDAQEGVSRPSLDLALEDAVQRAVAGQRVVDSSGDAMYSLLPAALVPDSDYVGDMTDRALSNGHSH